MLKNEQVIKIEDQANNPQTQIPSNTSSDIPHQFPEDQLPSRIPSPQTNHPQTQIPSNTPSGIPHQFPEDQLPSNNELRFTDGGVAIFNGSKYTEEFKKIAIALARKLNNNQKAARDLNIKYKIQLKEASI